MDRECVSLLPRVCEVLAASGSSLPDDTSLEKLLDWFTGLTKAGTSLLESCPCLFEFISTVVHNTTLDPSILSFTLRLTGLVAVTEDAFKVLQESSVLDLVFTLQHWQEAGLWEDPCIRIGWIQGLRTMMQHPKALDFFVQADFLKPLLQLQTDKSLFVASAANQMLAHVLLSCQSVSSVGSNGVDEEGEDVGRSSGSISDVEYLAVTVETSQDYATVVTAISEYLKKSLVPREHAQLHQSLQILKLLALLLAQTRPPLWEKLLQTVADSVDELLAAGDSQIILPLMDVILAAYSSCDVNRHVPDQRVSRLLSFMLNIRKPTDLIQAAAAFLRRGHHDLVHTAQSARVLLLPLDIITGLNLLTTTADEQRFLMVEQLKSKTSCISVICVCLTNTPQITLTAADCLPCSPVLIVTAVLLLLRLCSGDSSSSSSSSSSCHEVSRNVIGSSKVQKCALEALTALSGSPGVEVKLAEVFTLLVQSLDSPDSDPTVLHKSYQALVKWISVCSDLSSITDQHRQNLLQVVRKRSCDIRWEVRDSTVEFLGRLAGVSVIQATIEEASDASVALLGGCCFTTPLLRAALQDPESYVRASAIAALAQTLAASWQQGAALTQEQTEIVNKLLEVLSQDTEGFARRAVVRYFIAWLSSRSSHSSPPPPASSLLMPSVRSVLSRGSADLDWEVKVHTLELAELLLDETFSGQRGYTKGNPTQTHPYAVIPGALHTRTHNEEDVVGVLNSLVQCGVISALLSGLVDCDRPVALRACRLLITLREVVCPLSLGALDATAAMATVARVTCELPGCGWAREVRKMLAMKAKDANAERGFSGGEVVDFDDCGEAGQEVVSIGGQTPCVSVCEVLRSLDLDERLDVLTRSSDHVHNSPFSLLQDILTASSARSQPDTQQEVIVDCY